MADEKKLALAKEVYASLCGALDRREWKYKKEEDELLVRFDVNGDDFPMAFIMYMDVDRQLIRVLSPMPFVFPEDKRIDGAIATVAASDALPDGSFDYDITSGKTYFRMTNTYRDGKIGEGLFQYIIECATYVVDLYNDKLFAVSKGMMSIDEFLKERYN
ncbi:MAG: hypothetical protein MJ114_06625 [Acetatifactor sp.]|nr:hypothetical protein [Acetatifactor sp.]